MNEKVKNNKSRGRNDKNYAGTRNNFDKKGKGKRGSDERSRSRNDSDESKSPQMGKSSSVHGNDPMWYAYNEQMLSDAASLAFSNPLGSTVPKPIPDIKWMSVAADGVITTTDTSTVPGILTFNFVPGPGVSKDATSPLNVAAKNLYSYVRHANSGHTNYESQDLMLYIVAMDSAYTFWANMVRAYGFMATYAQSNRYLAKTLVESLGFDFNDLENRLADFRAFINLYAYKLGSICVPSHMSYVSRHIWMVSHVWVDSVSKKSQMYAYVPYNFWELNEIGSQEGAVLNLVKWGSYPSMRTFDQLKTIGGNLVNKILASEDMMIMSGDILKAFGAENLFNVSSIPEGFYLVPEYSEEVCMQIQNLTAWGAPPDTLQIKSEVTTGILRYEPMVDCNPEPSMIKKLFLNVRKDSVTPSDVMVATRCMSMVTHDVVVGEKTYRAFDTMGSEFVTDMTIHSLIESTDPQNKGAMFHTYYRGHSVPLNLATNSVNNWKETLLFAAELEKFDWHPYVYLIAKDASSYFNAGTLGDFDNYTSITDYELYNLP